MSDLTTTVRAACAAATPGPWRGDCVDGSVKYDVLGAGARTSDTVVICGDDGNEESSLPYGVVHERDEALILHAPEWLLSLCDQVEALEKALAEMIPVNCDALHHAKADRHEGSASCPIVARALAALARTPETGR